MDIDTSDINQLKKKGKFGEPVALELARSNEIPIEDMNYDVLSLSSNDGYTVAHSLATKNNLPEQFMTPEVLRLGLGTRYKTVAHTLAGSGNLPKYLIDKDTLKIADDDGWSVAHSLAMSGYENIVPELFDDPEILLLKDNEDRYVYRLLEKYRMRLKDVDNAKDEFELYLIAMSKYKYPKSSFEDFKKVVDKYGLDKVKQLVKITGKQK